jgi:mannose/fructose/N-acetylgalactosamine-specific phosphotransferase system component IID
MIDLLLWMGIVYFMSRILRWFATRRYSGFTTFLMVFGFVGVVVHELSHYIACKIVGMPTMGLFVYYRNEYTGDPSPHGHVSVSGLHEYTMSQEFVVDLAPLFTCSILILVMLDVVNVATDPLWFVLGWSFILSFLMGAPPSVPDLAGIYRAFYKFPGNSLFQLANIIGAFLMGWLVGSLVPITFPFRCMQYVYYTILTIAFYFVFKGIGLLGLRMFTRPQPSQKGAPVHKFRLKENR